MGKGARKDMVKYYNPHKSTRYTNLGDAESPEGFPELYSDREHCCGCSACCAACPVQAIAMSIDEEGFLYPIVDAHKCIKCYKCISTCAFKIDQAARGV